MKHILITGSTDGIGKLAADHLSEMGHTVYLHGRNQEKLEKGVSELRSQYGNQNIMGFLADFSDLKQVQSMADEVNQNVPQLDVIINNAGILKVDNPITAEGLDIRFSVNYYAPYVLTYGVLDMLRQRPAPRVINVSSAAQSTVDLSALRGDTPMSQSEAYSQSKLALAMWNTRLAEDEKELLAIVVNPGSLLDTNMAREAFGRHISSADKGAKILTKLATNDKYEGRSGKYYDNDLGTFRKANRDAYDAAKIDALIQTTNEVLDRLDIHIDDE